MLRCSAGLVLLLACVSAHAQTTRSQDAGQRKHVPVSTTPSASLPEQTVRAGDAPQLELVDRNNAVNDGLAPDFWDLETGENIKWTARLGSICYGSPVVSGGKVFIGTNNSAAYLKRFPRKIDLGVLLCFAEADGGFQWQYSSEKLPTGRIHDWPMTGICSTPFVQGDRMWLVNNRGEVVCLDTEGYRDGEDDGPAREPHLPLPTDEADLVWKFDMMQALGVSQHNMTNCSPVVWGDFVFVCTSNGVDETHVRIPAPHAPSFLALDKITGKVLWTDDSPGANILHGQWSSPALGTFDGVAQVLFAGGDGWLYSFRADAGRNGHPEFLWKFDGNPKWSVYRVSAQHDRNPIVAPPVVHDGLVYLTMGDDPDHGEGPGDLWCIDPKRQGDVSPQLVVDPSGRAIPHQRIQANAPVAGFQPRIVHNPNSAVVWHYTGQDLNQNGKFEFAEEFHRSLGPPAIKDDLLFICDYSGVAHCLNSKTGKAFWTCDTQSECWGSPLICGSRVFLPLADSDLALLALSADPAKSLNQAGDAVKATGQPAKMLNVGKSIFGTPTFSNGVLYLATQDRLIAIRPAR